MIVRQATVDDAQAIASVHVRTWQSAYRGLLPDAVLDGLVIDEWAARWRQTLADPPRRAFVAVENDRIIGFCSVGPCRDEGVAPLTGEVYTLYVLPHAHGNGIGTRLLDTGLQTLKSLGYQTAKLWVLTTNDPARRFYERRGWLPDGATQTEFWAGATLDETRYEMSFHRPAMN